MNHYDKDRDNAALGKWYLAPVPKYVAELESRIAVLEAEKAKLDEYERAPTVALLEWPAKSWPNLRLVSGAYATSGTSVELIARPTRKDGE